MDIFEADRLVAEIRSLGFVPLAYKTDSGVISLSLAHAGMPGEYIRATRPDLADQWEDPANLEAIYDVLHDVADA